MNIEYFRRETAKKNIGLTELPTASKSVTIAKGLEPADFIGMILPLDNELTVVTKVEFEVDAETDEVAFFTFENFKYTPKTGVLSLPM